MAVVIQTFTTPADPGGGNPERTYFGPLLGAGWTRLSVHCQVNNVIWPGSLVIDPGETTGDQEPGFAYWFNAVHTANSSFTAADPNQLYLTTALDRIRITTNAAPAGMQVTIQVSADAFAAPANCQYGTQLNGVANGALIVTSTVLDSALARVGMSFLSRVLVQLLFSTVNLNQLCGKGPPPLPTITLETLDAGINTAQQILNSILWFSYCECTPGAPAPTPFPDPTQQEPDGWPGQVVFGCSEVDLCASLIEIRRSLAAIQNALGEDLALTTLIQRYQLPFAYIRGAVHSNQSGTRSFGVSRLVGMQFDLDALEGEHRAGAGNPPYIFDLGWMSIMTPDGMIQEKRISQAHLVWEPQLMGEATIFGFELTPGTVGHFTELEAEP